MAATLDESASPLLNSSVSPPSVYMKLKTTDSRIVEKMSTELTTSSTADGSSAERIFTNSGTSTDCLNTPAPCPMTNHAKLPEQLAMVSDDHNHTIIGMALRVVFRVSSENRSHGRLWMDAIDGYRRGPVTGDRSTVLITWSCSIARSACSR